MPLWTEANVKNAYVCYNTEDGELDCLHCDFSTYRFQQLVRHLNDNHPRESTGEDLALEAARNLDQIQKPWKEVVKSHKKSRSNDSSSSGLFIKDPVKRPSKKPKVEKKIKSPKTEEKRPSNFFWSVDQESGTSSEVILPKILVFSCNLFCRNRASMKLSNATFHLSFFSRDFMYLILYLGRNTAAFVTSTPSRRSP